MNTVAVVGKFSLTQIFRNIPDQVFFRSSKARNTATNVVPKTFDILGMKRFVVRTDEILRVINAVVNEIL